MLQELQHALNRHAPIYGEIAAYATTADAYHMTQPPASGDGAYRAMRRALSTAQISPVNVDYINAHATSTPVGDSAENAAIATLMMGEGGLEKGREGDVCVSSIKGALGHLLGAAGAVEAVASVMAIKDVSPILFHVSQFSRQRRGNPISAEELYSAAVGKKLSPLQPFRPGILSHISTFLSRVVSSQHPPRLTFSRAEHPPSDSQPHISRHGRVQVQLRRPGGAGEESQRRADKQFRVRRHKCVSVSEAV